MRESFTRERELLPLIRPSGTFSPPSHPTPGGEKGHNQVTRKFFK